MDGLTMVRQFNHFYGDNKSIIRKALSSAVGVGQALIPEKLEEVITNTILHLSPELNMVEMRFDNQKFHEFNRLTSLPAAGGAMGEGAVTPTRNSTYARASVQLKIVRRKGTVTNFLQDTSAKYIDASAAEMESHLLRHAYDMASYIVNGNAAADPYTFSGLDHFISTYRIIEAQGGVVPTNLGFLNDMIDNNLEKQGAMHNKAILMSPRMLSKVSDLLTNVRLNQGLTAGGLTQVDIGGGWRLNAYRDIPIIVSSAMRPTSAIPSLASSTSTVGGTIAAGTYYFRVAAVKSPEGEQLASPEQSQVTTGTTSTITLDWTTAVDNALYYKIYAGTTSGDLTLISVVSAFTYDSVGTINVTPISSVILTSLAPDASVLDATLGIDMTADRPLVATGGIAPESVYLWDLDEYQGLGKLVYTNTSGSKFNGLVTMTPLAIIDDDLPFLIKSYAALVPSYEGTSAVHKGLRVA